MMTGADCRKRQRATSISRWTSVTLIALLCVTGIMLPLDRKAAAQTPANLPMVEQVPAAAPQAVDGTWIINTI